MAALNAPATTPAEASARTAKAAAVVADHFDSGALLKGVLGAGARSRLKKADRKALAAFLAHRATTRLTDWVATLPAQPSVRVEPHGVELGRDSTREVVATFDLYLGPRPGDHHLVEVHARRGKKKKAPWKIWDVRCGTAGLHLSRQYTAQFRSLRRDGGLEGLVAKARSLTPYSANP